MSLDLAGFDRVSLIDSPTPLQRLERLEAALAADCDPPEIWIKREDIAHLGGGGNKLRKLEFLIGHALADGCDTFITGGGRQSNHARQSAAASARHGLACELVLADVVPREDEAYLRNGNVLLNDLFGATIHHLSADADSLGFAYSRAAALAAAGRKAYVVGAGGSSPVGNLGYVACADEIVAQERALGLRFSAIVLANGSAGTHAGLAAGLAALGDDPTRARSFSVLATALDAHRATHRLANETLSLLGEGYALPEDAIVVFDGQRGRGYGIPTSGMVDAVRLLARTEGLLLDPVYSGKAFAGLLVKIRERRFTSRDAVLFLMTGGAPGLFAYEPAFRTAVIP